MKPPERNFEDTGYEFLLTTLTEWGVDLYSGVTGGGVFHFLKYLSPFKPHQRNNVAEFLSLGEYSAGFVPLGYYLASGRIAAAIATMGAATKLLSCGLTDAKLHDIPAVYLVPICRAGTEGYCPLQDTSLYGSNIVQQLQAELPNSVFVLDNTATLTEKLTQAKVQLNNSKPVVLVLIHEVLTSPSPDHRPPATEQQMAVANPAPFIEAFRQASAGRRVVVLAGEELARYPDANYLTTQLCAKLRAPIVWSINGANAVCRTNPYGYGYISFGGNDRALTLWQSLGENDVLLAIGVCPDEYTINLQKISAAHTFFITNIRDAYGHIDNGFSHVSRGAYQHFYAPLDITLCAIIEAIEQQSFHNKHASPAPKELNTGALPLPGKDYTDLAKLYQHLDSWWPIDSIGIDDVCLAYKDRQYVTQRPNNNIQFYSLYRGSAMGGAYGAAIGARLAAPQKTVFLFSGDGCFRLFAGCLGEAREIGVVLFLFNNANYSIVEQGLSKIIPDVPNEYYHSQLYSLDYCAIARASGWEAEKLKTDLSNLNGILNKLEKPPARSMLIEVSVDPRQELGSNPRVRNL
ncbi:acetolactate synthase-1/2/3 large subunit [Nitrosovibrio sp. Nv6]|nr:acetolactate synthase-1/2/3 large subunit [Nitrosovibrio sp. Nv6]